MKKKAISLGSLIPKLTKQAYEKYGFSTAQLIADWPAIVGPQLARTTRPEKLKWPRKNNTFLYEDDTPASDFKQKDIGATLVVRVDGPHSLELQFSAAQIIERINSFFGYRAVTDIRIIQAPVKDPNPVPLPLPKVDASDLVQGLEEIKNDALRDALHKMAQGVKRNANKKS